MGGEGEDVGCGFEFGDCDEARGVGEGGGGGGGGDAAVDGGDVGDQGGEALGGGVQGWHVGGASGLGGGHAGVVARRRSRWGTFN